MSRWDPKPPLDLNPWSLLPSIGLSRRATVYAEIIWVVYVAGFWSLHANAPVSLLAFALIGAWSLFYIITRLGGRVAVLGGAAPRIRPDSPFQARLFGDLLHVSMFVLALVVIAVGDTPWDMWRW